MNCKNCGSPLVPEDKFCKLCGTPVQKNNNLGGMPNNQGNRPNGPAPMHNPMQQPMKPAPGKPNPGMGGAPFPVKPGNNGPMKPAPGPVPKPMNNQPHGMNLEKTQVLGNTQNMRPVGGPNRPQGMAPNGKPTMGQGPQRQVAPAPVPGMPMNNTPVAPAPAPTPVTSQEPESKGGAMKIILIVLLILGLAVGGYFGYKAFANKDDGDSDGGSDRQVVNTTTKNVDLSGYTFEVPTKFMVQNDADALSLDDGTYGFIMTIIDYSYAQLSPTKVVSNFNNEGMSAEYSGEKTIGDAKYQLFAVKEGAESVYVVYTSLGASKLLGLTIYNNPTTVLPTQANVDEAVKIGSSGKYTGSHSIETSGLEKINPKKYIVEEETSTGDVYNYTEDYSYADVTVNELY